MINSVFCFDLDQFPAHYLLIGNTIKFIITMCITKYYALSAQGYLGVIILYGVINTNEALKIFYLLIKMHCCLFALIVCTRTFEEFRYKLVEQ